SNSVLNGSPLASFAALRKGSKAYDLLAAAPLILFYSLNVGTLLHAVHEKLQQFDVARPDLSLCLTILAKLAALALMTVFIGILFLRRTPISSAPGIMPKIGALAGTYTALLIPLLPAREISAFATAVSIALLFGGTG